MLMRQEDREVEAFQRQAETVTVEGQGPVSLLPRDVLSPLLPDVASHEMHRTPATKLAERSDMTRHTVNLAWRTLPFFTIRLPI
jgi:hypothetical protein